MPFVRCVMDALTMSPTPAVVSENSRASTSEDLARRRFRHRGVVDHRQHVWRRRIAVLMLESGLHGFVLDATLNMNN